MLYSIIKRLLILMFVITATDAVATDQSFSVTMKLGTPISITKLRDLIFPDTAFIGAQDLIIASTAVNSASFTVTGRKNKHLVVSIVPVTVAMSAPGVTGTITVDTFTINPGPPHKFNVSGNAAFTVGATAHILATSEDGDYTGTAAIRVVYQ